ncbi:diaminobutyrate--2-oxoglutarate transaminase [Acinetobacter sp. HY1485]|uniref:diaminobutyrate--2-oxoglutarate transaminase n=1 Tax=Acinetobacter sp. HY1485 TaxID=2970918 RepID=UPI0022B97B24|nr:diaminobutyrate--2-oxoglutarate transaminase [Acinetobacter sp. HY1485]
MSSSIKEKNITQGEYSKKYESKVRSYALSFPDLFNKAKGSLLFSTSGKQYIDLFSGAGALNYGHNNEVLKESLLNYIQSDGITHSLDLMTFAKENFIKSFKEIILDKRGLKYKLQFTGPTGTNAVEAALKLARKIKKRSNIGFFSNSFHGVSLGALSVTSDPLKRAGAGIPLNNTISLPYEGSLETAETEFNYLKHILSPESGIEKPAAIILETIQGEGGVNLVSKSWIEKIYKIIKDNDILLIVDDIQAGCGRSGNFFSFENFEIEPDIVILSKSLSAYGLPMSLVLLKDEYDIWQPAEHNGTFRGNNHAFITAERAISYYWADNTFEKNINKKNNIIVKKLKNLEEIEDLKIKGRGMFYGISFRNSALANICSKKLFENGILIETSGRYDEVLKILPALNIPDNLLEKALDEIVKVIKSELER